MDHKKILKIILSVLIIPTLLSLEYPQTVYSQAGGSQPGPASSLPEGTEPGGVAMYFPGEGAATTAYLPLVYRALPRRETITLSIFSASPDSILVYEKNLDSNGIPILLEGPTNGNGYNPSWICRYALYVVANHETNPSASNYQKIQNVMTWIKNNKVERNNFITWEFYEDLPEFNLTAPWTSALTNAWCSGALLLGYKMTGDEELETLAGLGLEYIFTPVSEGGGLHVFDNGNIWFEEAPSVETPSHILNGFIFVIDVLDMFNSYYANDRYQDFFDRAVTSLVNRIDQYDVGYGSIYDLYTRGNKIGTDYHAIHVEQLYYLYLRTGYPRLLEYCKKWYALEYQNEYEVLDAGQSNPALDVVQDGIYWWNYILVKLPRELSFNFERPYDVRAINFYLYFDNNPTGAMSIAYRAEDGIYIAIPPANYTIELSGSNNTNGHVTNVYILTFIEPIHTQSLRMNMEKTTITEAGVFREIGIWKNMDYEFQVDMSSRYQIFEDIIHKRNQD